MTGAQDPAPAPDKGGASAEYVGIPGETELDAASAKEIASQTAAMPPGSFLHPDHPDDPNDPVTGIRDEGPEPKPDRGSGSNLAKFPLGTIDEVTRLMRQHDTPLGRIELKQDEMFEVLSRMERLLDVAQRRPRGRPVDDRYQLIHDHNRHLMEAVCEAVDAGPLRDGLLAALVSIKRKMERDLAARQLSVEAGSNPGKALRERKRRSKAKAAKPS